MKARFKRDAGCLVGEKEFTMKYIALRAYSMPATGRFFMKISAIAAIAALCTACAGISPSVGISVPIGRMGGVGVSIGGGGTVSGSVGVGTGGASVGVGASGQLPKKAEPEAEKKEEKKP
jgi:hypothetical protein